MTGEEVGLVTQRTCDSLFPSSSCQRHWQKALIRESNKEIIGIMRLKVHSEQQKLVKNSVTTSNSRSVTTDYILLYLTADGLCSACRFDIL